MVVAQAIRTDKNARGIRPFDATRDLGAVGRLLEEAFRPEHTFPLSNAPLLRHVGIVLWTISYAPVFPENISGFVWLEEGRVVGNVTITQDEGRLDRYLISNVAVKPEYRRQGIARSLMLESIEHLRARGAQWVLLNVRPTNPGAIKLYRDLGFQQVEMRGEWIFSPEALPSESEGSTGKEVRPLRASDYRTVAEVVRAATPSLVQQFHAPRFGDFAPSWDDRFAELLSDFFIGQVTRRWVLQRENKLGAVMLLRAQRLATPHRLAVEVHPAYRGQVETDLLAFALREFARFARRDIRATAASTHPEWITALESQGFMLSNGLTLMALSL